MKDALLMGVVRSLSDRSNDLSRLFGKERLFAREGREVFAGNVIHGEEMLALLFADFVDANDVGMTQPGGKFGFALKALDIDGRSEETRRNSFDGDEAFETGLPGFIDYAHAAAGDDFDDFVIAE